MQECEMLTTLSCFCVISLCSQMFYKVGALENFAAFTEKTLVR